VSYNAASHAILAMAWTSALEVLEVELGVAHQILVGGDWNMNGL